MDARPRLLDRVRDHLRKLHYSYRTEQQYLFWIRRFILFHGKRHPSDMAAREVEAFLQSRYLPVVFMTTEVRAVVAHRRASAGSSATCYTARDCGSVRRCSSGEGHSVRIPPGHRANCQRCEGPLDNPAGGPARSGATAPREREDATRIGDAQGRECGAESAGSVSANATPKEEEKRRKEERKREGGLGLRAGPCDCARFAIARPVGAVADAHARCALRAPLANPQRHTSRPRCVRT